jgi:AraC-like DNA-binding protein
VSVLEIRDPDQMGEQYRGKGLRFIPLEAGPYRSALRTLSIGGLTFYHMTWETATLVEGAASPASTYLVFSNPRHDAVLTGQRVRHGESMLYGAGAEHMSVAAHRDGLNIVFPEGTLESELASRLGIAQFDFTGQRRLLSIGQAGHAALHRIVLTTLRAFTADTSIASTDAATEQFVKCTVGRVAAALLEQPDRFVAASRACLSDGEVLLRSRAFLTEARGKPVYLGELCGAVGVSARTLQKAFGAGLGMSPMQYLKVRRLHQVRQRLMTTTPAEVNVKVVAREAGFCHLGQFAADYRRTFGELPSATLRS